MTALDTAKAVLAKASLYDQTFSTPDLGVAVAWSEVLGQTNRDDALAVVATHYATETRRIMPADIVAGVKRIRTERLRAVSTAELEPDLDGDDPRQFIAAKRERIAAIADGRPLPSPAALPARDVAGLLTDTEKRLPKMPTMRGRDVAW